MNNHHPLNWGFNWAFPMLSKSAPGSYVGQNAITCIMRTRSDNVETDFLPVTPHRNESLFLWPFQPQQRPESDHWQSFQTGCLYLVTDRKQLTTILIEFLLAKTLGWQPCDQLATGWDYWAIKKLGLGFSSAVREERRSTSFFCCQSFAWGSNLWVGSSDWEFFRSWMKMRYTSISVNIPEWL